MKVFQFYAFSTLLLSIFFSSLLLADDRITSLPNYSGKLSEQYSGYLTVDSNNGRNLHYWFVPSQGNPKTDPMVLWLNGGPGCSSLDGFWYEHGPLHFAPGKDNLTIIDNPYAWTKVANVLYLEAPAGVGFSYSDTSSDYNTDDSKTAADNYQALKVFFKQYSQYLSNDFYISGESYAVIYVPTLAQRVLEGSLAGDNNFNFKGILVGNGVSDWSFDGTLTSLVPFAHGHGLISTETYEQITKYCTQDPNSDQCNDGLSALDDNMNDIDIYDVYSDCFHQRPNSKFFPALKSLSLSNRGKKSPQQILAKNHKKKTVGESPPCIDSTKAETYLNKPEVKQAIHVKSNIDWDICTEQINYQTNDTVTMLPIYKELIKNNIRVLVYSGDTDGSVPFVGTQKWITSLNLERKSLWRQWRVKSDEGTQVAGYVSEYKGLTFATVKGSGHMVPQFRPLPAFYLFQRFLAGQSL